MDLASTKTAPEMRGYMNIHCKIAGYWQLETKQSQPVHSIWAMGIALANHFRRVLSVSEIHCLRRLMREGSPERISRSWQLVCWSVAPVSE